MTEELPDRATSTHRLEVTQEVTAYKGPLPPPELLRGYEELVPGSADRILRMAEEQGQHRRKVEAMVVAGASQRSWWGLWLGFFALLAVLVAGVIVAVNGAPVSGTVIVTADLATVVGCFVWGTHSQRLERQHKHALATRK